MIKKASEPVAKPWHPTPEQEKQIRETDATFEWLSQQTGEFFLPYAGRYIAARDHQIVASGETYDALMEQLANCKIGPEDVLIHYVRKPGWTIYR
ncbi:MAG TPA: DUF5678 domain-containing protein [Gemmataceae bacterium]|jgi:hypothetical protein|nr:DUF5678 domain-containing protein [Gemmataceae bacterium]